VGHELNGEGVARIAGLGAILNGAVNYNAAATGRETAFTGEIILGGGGNDTITGGAGDDVMDGDAWLNARISATDNNGVVSSHNTLLTLTAGLLNGTINPGNLVIVREILQANAAGDADIAVFSGVRANYTIGAIRADGSMLITDNVGTDGVDLVRNIEIARFTDQDVLIGNARATGTPIISITKKPMSIKMAMVSISNMIASTFGLVVHNHAEKLTHTLQDQKSEADWNEPFHHPAIGNTARIG
jgi:hypothetical protein